MAERLFRVELLAGNEIVGTYTVRRSSILATLGATVLPFDVRMGDVNCIRIVTVAEPPVEVTP
jgi:hypothetical protein